MRNDGIAIGELSRRTGCNIETIRLRAHWSLAIARPVSSSNNEAHSYGSQADCCSDGRHNGRATAHAGSPYKSGHPGAAP
jgi:hypothetical protein